MRIVWRLVRIPFLVGVGLAIGFLVPYTFYLDREVRSRFDDLSWQIPSRVYARPLQLAPGLPMSASRGGRRGAIEPGPAMGATAHAAGRAERVGRCEIRSDS